MKKLLAIISIIAVLTAVGCGEKRKKQQIMKHLLQLKM